MNILKKTAIALAATFALGASAQAAPITFVATGHADVSGYFTIDDTALTGSSEEFYLNTIITDLNLTAFGETFTFADVAFDDETIIDSSGTDPVIINGAGLLADNGPFAIAFFPDDYLGSGADGDASLAFGTGFGDFEFFQVQWVVGEPSEVPLPAALPLFLAGIAGFGAAARKRKNAA